jgi:hypothetical protein
MRMQKDERERLIGVYRDGYRAVVDALQGATDDQLDARPRAGAWTAREIVHHLADSEMTAAIRLRLLLVEDRPEIRGYDQDAFVSRLPYDRPHEASLMAFRYARECTAQILERLSDEQWLRAGTHTEVGAFSVERWLETYAPHAHNHARQILQARAESQKPKA